MLQVVMLLLRLLLLPAERLRCCLSMAHALVHLGACSRAGISRWEGRQVQLMVSMRPY